MILTSSLNFGIKRSIPHWLGIITGAPFMMSVIGLGLTQFFIWWPASFLGMKLIGAAYLLYLAMKIALAPTVINDKKQQPMNYWQGFLFQWINPKAWVMSIGAIATFSSNEHSLLQVLSISGTFLWVGFFAVGSWLVIGSHLQKLLLHPFHRHVFNIVMALILAGSILPMLIESINNLLSF